MDSGRSGSLRLLVLGASGGCGQWIARLAGARGHSVTALVRPTATIDVLPGIEVVHGDVADTATLESVIPGHDAVLSALGLRRAGRAPWAPLRSPPDLTARVTRSLLPAMQRHGVQRLIAISAAGVGDSHDRLSWPVRRLVASSNIAVAYRDLAEMEALLAASDRDWLVVRPVTLTGGPPRRRGRSVARYGLWSTIRRSEVANWMLDAVAQSVPFAERRVMIGR